MHKKIKKYLKILALLLLNLLYHPQTSIRLVRVLKNYGLAALKSEILLLINKPRHYATRLKCAHIIFAQEQNEFAPEILIAQAKTFAYQPLISIILPTYKTPLIWLKKCIASVQNQFYANWQLCIADDGSNQADLSNYLNELSQQDPRIQCILSKNNGGISQASNNALTLAKGEFIALLDHDDELTKDALFWAVQALNNNPNLDYLYSNECKVDEQGQTSYFMFKPDWSPEHLINDMYTGHLSIYRKSLIDKLGGFRSTYDFSQDYDLALRVTEATEQIYHLNRVLYLWRKIEGSAAAGGKDFAHQSNMAALADAAKRRNLNAEIIKLPYANRLKLNLPYQDKVSIIIPSDNVENIKTAVNGILTQTDYENYEIIVVTKTPIAETVKPAFASHHPLKFCLYNLPYNFSDKCNAGAKMAEGTILIFYNDDVVPVANHWLKNLIEYLYLPGVGGVSPKLIYPNKTVQYAGMYNAVREYDFTATVQMHKTDQDYYTHYDHLLTNTGVLSGACLAMHKALFDNIEGFDAINTPTKHSDIDLSFKIRNQGLRCVYTPYASLWHLGNHSWRHTKQDKSVIYCLNRWGEYMAYDPYITQQIQTLLRLEFQNGFAIHAKNNKTYDPSLPAILLVSHELSNTGAPRALYLLAQALSQEKYNLMLASPTDGPMRADFAAMNLPIMIDDRMFSAEQSHVFNAFAKDFDLVIMNTIKCAPLAQALAGKVKTIWWLHEATGINEYLQNTPPFNYQEILTHSKNLYIVSEYAKNYLDQYNTTAKVIPLGIPDSDQNVQKIKKDSQDKIVFTMIGTLCPRKAQDILVQTVQELPKSYQEKAIFNIIGAIGDQDFFNKLNKTMSSLNCIQHHGAISNTEVLSILSHTDVLICISRDEPFSITALEAWMQGVPCILATTVGVSKYIKEGQNGFLIDMPNPIVLGQLLRKIIDHRELLDNTHDYARATFTNEFNFEKFANTWLKEIKNIL